MREGLYSVRSALAHLEALMERLSLAADLQAEIDYIEMKLEERERERNYRLRLVKGKIQSRQVRNQESGG